MKLSNEQIAIEIMGWCRCSIENHNIPIPDYLRDRRYAAAIVEAIRSKPDKVINIFNEEIQKYVTDITNKTGKCEPIDYLLFITPDIICNASMSAIRQHKE